MSDLPSSAQSAAAAANSARSATNSANVAGANALKAAESARTAEGYSSTIAQSAATAAIASATAVSAALGAAASAQSAEEAAATGILTIEPGDNVTVDVTDPRHPIVSATGGGSSFDGNLDGDLDVTGTSYLHGKVRLDGGIVLGRGDDENSPAKLQVSFASEGDYDVASVSEGTGWRFLRTVQMREGQVLPVQAGSSLSWFVSTGGGNSHHVTVGSSSTFSTIEDDLPPTPGTQIILLLAEGITVKHNDNAGGGLPIKLASGADFTTPSGKITPLALLKSGDGFWYETNGASIWSVL